MTDNQKQVIMSQPIFSEIMRFLDSVEQQTEQDGDSPNNVLNTMIWGFKQRISMDTKQYEPPIPNGVVSNYEIMLYSDELYKMASSRNSPLLITELATILKVTFADAKNIISRLTTVPNGDFLVGGYTYFSDALKLSAALAESGYCFGLFRNGKEKALVFGSVAKKRNMKKVDPTMDEQNIAANMNISIE